MFGQYLRTLDDKCRVVLPPAFKKKLNGSLYLTIGLDGQAEIWEEVEYRKYKSVLDAKDSFNPKVRKLKNVLNAYTYDDITIDKQNRLTLPKPIYEYVFRENLEGKELYFVGADDHIQIWDKIKFENLIGDVTPNNISDLASEIADAK